MVGALLKVDYHCSRHIILAPPTISVPAPSPPPHTFFTSTDIIFFSLHLNSLQGCTKLEFVIDLGLGLGARSRPRFWPDK